MTQHIHARTVWISDVHLGFKDCRVDYLASFLKNVKCDTLYLVGDIIDLWAMKKRLFWPKEHYEILMLLYQLAEQGTQVIYVPGNHDDPVRKFAGQNMGPIKIMHEHDYQTVKGKTILIMHGDAMDAYVQHSWLTKIIGEVAYRTLLLVNRWTNRIRKWMGKPYFSLSYQIKENVSGAKKAIEEYKSQCIKNAKHRGYDGVICGHIHYPDLDISDDFMYANTGDWIENCTALTEDFSGKFHLLSCIEQTQLHDNHIKNEVHVA
ncbi:UDP-2,3-diacylglucosamine diphosphatase [Marinicellulosiphila megalodicopiae]|uniref:UDP-2,3-diacylglucosamine diphosphatase n=1 Tax=Marinicellulosiphila megalodicopiae TaxID=2724896 RepID=UPI003BAF4C88